MRIMICPNTALFIIRLADCFTSPSISVCESLLILLNFLLCVNWCITASTIITAPSTINPKSKAPRLIRLPLTPNKFIMMMAKSMASGITEATKKPARKFPRKSTSTNITINAPSSKFLLTVLIELFTIFVRSRKGSIITPSGNVFCMSVMRSFMSLITSLLLAPFSIITTAPETSSLPL